MVWDSAHGDFVGIILAARGERYPQDPGAGMGVLKEHFIKITHSVKKNSTRMLLFYLQVLFEHRGEFDRLLGSHNVNASLRLFGQSPVEAG